MTKRTRVIKPQPRRLRIGIDCHGSFLNTRHAFKRLARRKFQISIPPNLLSREQIINGEVLTADEYERVAAMVFSQSGYVRRYVEANEGAEEVLKQLLAEKHLVTLITSSDADAHIALLEWLRARKLSSIPTFNVGRNQIKANIAIRAFDVVLDDDIEQVMAWTTTGAHTFILSHEGNTWFKNDTHGITRVQSFHSFYEQVQLIASESMALSEEKHIA